MESLNRYMYTYIADQCGERITDPYEGQNNRTYILFSSRQKNAERKWKKKTTGEKLDKHLTTTKISQYSISRT